VADPVSWKVIEPGWDVVGSEGEELGSVHEVVGDPNADIFTGINVSPGVLRQSRYVPSEQVAAIFEGRVELGLDAGTFERLEEAEPAPPSAEIRSDTTDLPDDDTRP
jgi:hypothetical protein